MLLIALKGRKPIKLNLQNKQTQQKMNYFLKTNLLFIMCMAFLFIGCDDETPEEMAQESCTQFCENGGVVTIDCECFCPEGFEGENCEISTCNLNCQNGGLVSNNCTCDCPDGFEGEQCEICIGKCNLVYQDELRAYTGNTFYVNDYELVLPDKFVLTGLGFNSAATLLLIGRELKQDCTLGEPLEFRDGFDPSGDVAVFYEVPDGHVVTGVGFGESQDIYRLVVNHNELLLDEECDLYLGPEMLYDNNANASVNEWLKISDSSYDTRFNLFGGLGIKFTGSSNRQVKTEAREIINQF